MAKFDALVIDPRKDTRKGLKELLHHEQHYGEATYQSVYIVSSPLDAVARLSDGEGVDVILISDRIPIDQINRFIQAAKEMEGERGVAYIVVLDAHNEEKTMVSEGLAYGADGFLSLPSSVSALREITEIANRIKAEAQERMVRVALRLLVDTLIDEIELRAHKLYRNDEHLGYGRQLKQAVRRLIGNEKRMFFNYLEILEEALARMNPIEFDAYLGNSKRVRDRFEAGYH